ncbi:MAG: HEPN domain-containing protein [Oscillospiraceae bacterium]|nr:HEPN domain-containing protein [Oscillospiraceae bacterium]MCL2278161.1 HEPN domain-containing protein [Oscillospiraceae bacterium]
MDKITINEWVSYSDMDLSSAKYLCGMNQKPLEIICYHCQQSAEKMLKAYWIYKNINPPRTHDLELLRAECENHDDSFAKLHDMCKRLNGYSTQPRYPSGIDLLESDMLLAIKDSEKIAEFVKERIVFDGTDD